MARHDHYLDLSNSKILFCLMQRANSLEKTLMLGRIEGRRRERQRMRWLDGITDSMDEFEQAPGDGDGQGCLVCCSPWGHKESDTTGQLNNNSACYYLHIVFKYQHSH